MSERYEFGSWVLDADAFQLRRDGAEVSMPPKGVELLLLVARAGGALVERERLERELWPDVHVTEHSLRQLVHRVRQILGAEGEILETVPRKGLRFGVSREAPSEEELPSGRPPAERDRLFGRASEIEALERWLDGARLVTIVGPAGVGKTRLAREVCRRWSEAVWCELADVAEASAMVHAIGRSLGLGLGGAKDPATQLGDALRARGPTSLVLDNLEHLVPSASPILGRWLDVAPGLRILTTSRRSLGLGGESLLPLEPLPDDDAIALFGARVAAADPRIALDSDRVRGVVARLDGLPLAIELAASRIRVLGLEDLAERLDDRLGLLRSGRPGRHGALESALDVSWDLLDPELQEALARLSAFAGGFSARAAEEVLGRERGLEQLGSLVDWSLVYRSDRRFSLLASVQEHAGRRADPAVWARAIEVHGQWAARSAGDPPDRNEAANLRIACLRAWERGDLEIAAATLLGWWQAVDGVGSYDELRDWLIRLLERDDLPLVRRGPLSSAYARLHQRLGGPSPRPHLERALASCTDPHVRAELLDRLATLDLHEGRTDRLEGWLSEAADLVRDDRVALARIQSTLGNALGQFGRLGEAIATLERAVAGHRAGGYTYGEAVALANLGSACTYVGRLREALDHQRAAVRLFHGQGDPSSVAQVLTHQAMTLADLGLFPAARTRLDEALAILHRQGAVRREAQARLTRSALALDQDRAEEGLGDAEDCIARFQALDEPRWVRFSVEGCVRALLQLDRLDEAATVLKRLYALGGERDVETHRLEASLLARSGAWVEAMGHLSAARAMLWPEERMIRARLACEEAEVALALGDLGAARSALAEAREISDRAEQGSDAWVRRRLAQLEAPGRAIRSG